jgi:hypothetical protein
VWDGDTEVIGRWYGCTIMFGVLELGSLFRLWLTAVGVIWRPAYCLEILVVTHSPEKTTSYSYALLY